MTGPQHYRLFDTAFGPCGVAWGDAGLTRLQLPETDREATEGRLRRSTGGTASDTAPPAVGHLIAALRRYFDGEAVNFEDVVIALPDTLGQPLAAIYAAARTVRWGETVSYGEVARRAGSPGSARLVGQAMARNPVPIVIPCHRVLASGGRLGGFSAFGGTVTKERLLVLERTRLAL